MTPVETATTEINSPAYQALKAKIHNDLLNRLNLDRLTRTSRAEAEPEVRAVIRDMLDRESQRTPLSFGERESLIGDVINELFGLGPLEALLKDPDISDILVNNSAQVFIERNGRIGRHRPNRLVYEVTMDLTLNIQTLFPKVLQEGDALDF